MTEDLKWSEHVFKVVNKCKSMSYLIRESFVNIRPQNFSLIFDVHYIGICNCGVLPYDDRGELIEMFKILNNFYGSYERLV